MEEYGTYSGVECILAVYKDGNLKFIIEKINPETIYFGECYNGYNHRYLEFDYTENGKELKGQVRVEQNMSFAIYPSWMTKHLKKQYGLE